MSVRKMVGRPALLDLRCAAMRRRPAPSDFDGWVAQLGISSRRQQAKHHLFASGSRALPALGRGLAHDKAIVRRQCVNVLDRLLDDDSLDVLVAALDDSDPEVVGRALHALACDPCKQGACRAGEETWVPRALTLLHHSNPDLRAAAIDALGKVTDGRPDVIAALAITSQMEIDRGLRGMARRRVGT
jgi:HEAT repeat protein